MRILLLHQHYKSPSTGGALRSWYLSAALSKRGHVVTVLTGGTPPEIPDDPPGVVVHWLPVPYRNQFGFARRLWAFFRYARMAVQMAGRLGPFDLCYAISTPLSVGWAALRIKGIYGTPFVFEVGDLWPDAPIALGFVRNPLIRRWLYRLERTVYAEAEKIVALSPPIADAVRKKARGKPVLVLTNFADTVYFRLVPKPSDLVWHYHTDNQFVITYAGAFGWANGLERVIACAEQCQKEKLPVLFLLVGDGAQRESLQRLCSRRGIRSVRFLPFCNRDGVRDILSITDAVFVSFRPEAILETGAPHKFFDGLAAGKLIILNFGGWLRDLVESTDCGFYAPAPNDLVTKIQSYLHGSNLLAESQLRSRQLAETQFSAQRLSEEFVRGVESASECVG